MPILSAVPPVPILPDASALSVLFMMPALSVLSALSVRYVTPALGTLPALCALHDMRSLPCQPALRVSSLSVPSVPTVPSALSVLQVRVVIALGALHALPVVREREVFPLSPAVACRGPARRLPYFLHRQTSPAVLPPIARLFSALGPPCCCPSRRVSHVMNKELRVGSRGGIGIWSGIGSDRDGGVM